MKKKPTVYIAVIVVWLCCAALLGWSLSRIIIGLDGYGSVRTAFIIALLSVNTLILATLWLGSIKDFMFSAAYAVTHKKLHREYEKVKSAPSPEKPPRFLLLYCTCNDFNADALSACRKQRYSNFKTVILDDSSDEEYKKRIDEYAARGGVEVVRRAERKGYKAGNLNNYLKGRTDYDYFVVLDSDEIIPPDYI